MSKDSKEFEELIGVAFENPTLLLQAFTHRSFLNEHREARQGHNERLEFLGDAVLELIVTDHLYRTYPEKTEGELTALRSALVNTHTLSAAASALHMNDFLLLSKGEAKDTGRARSFILANTFEAVVGALYVDQGYEVAKMFMEKHLLPRLGEIVEKRLWQDAKSHLQERIQDSVGITPSYEAISETGPDHDKRFTVGVYVGGELLAQGEGKSKQEAETAAARAALAARGW